MSDQLKLHLALNVRDVERSVEFYTAMFGISPVKHKPGYAKFDIPSPPVNLTLNHSPNIESRGALNHLGIQVRTEAEVEEARARLASSGLVTLEEKNTDCCYALQDKVWVTDPDGHQWEFFVVKVQDTRPDLEVTCATSATTSSAPVGCCG